MIFDLFDRHCNYRCHFQLNNSSESPLPRGRESIADFGYLC